MDGSFAGIAERLSGLTSLSLGWSPDQFWQSTPQELAAIFAAGSKGGPAGFAEPLTEIELRQLKDRDPDG